MYTLANINSEIGRAHAELMFAKVYMKIFFKKFVFF
jgi:hypothetical protein